MSSFADLPIASPAHNASVSNPLLGCFSICHLLYICVSSRGAGFSLNHLTWTGWLALHDDSQSALWRRFGFPLQLSMLLILLPRSADCILAFGILYLLAPVTTPGKECTVPTTYLPSSKECENIPSRSRSSRDMGPGSPPGLLHGIYRLGR